MRRSHTHLAARARYARAHTCAPTHPPAAPPAAGVMLDAAVAARLEQGGDSHRHLELSPKRCDSRCNCGMAHVIVGARVAASALSTHSAAAPSQGRHSSPQARIFFRQQMAGAPRPCLQPWTQIQQTQKMTPTDLTPLPCSTRAFTYARVWTPELTGPVRTTDRAVPYTLRSKRGAGRVASRGSSQEVRCGGRQDAICALWARNSRFARPAVAVCVRHWAETTSGRAQGIPGRARAAWRTVARRGRSPATTAKRADFTATPGVAVGSQGCGNAL